MSPSKAVHPDGTIRFYQTLENAGSSAETGKFLAKIGTPGLHFIDLFLIPTGPNVVSTPSNRFAAAVTDEGSPISDPRPRELSTGTALLVKWGHSDSLRSGNAFSSLEIR